MSFSIVTDTSANLPSEFLQREQVAVVPYTYTVRGQARNTVNLDAFDGEKFYDAMRKGMAVSTSLISPSGYEDFFAPMLERGEDLLFVSMSSGISNSYHCAEMAANELAERFPGRKLFLVDSLGASLGEGLLVLRAAELRRIGRSLEQTAAELRQLRHRVCQVFTVDDLMFLKKGGRLSGAAALVGTVLNIKPILKGDPEGKIVAAGKVRGRKKSVEALAERYETLAVDVEYQTVCIAQAGCPEDAAFLEELLRKKRPPKEILTVCYEPVTGSHVGPGALALFFLGGEDVRER